MAIPESVPRIDTVSVVLLQALRSPEGMVWAAKERAGFPPDVARDLIRRGLAREDPGGAAKAPDGPPQDKMLDGSRGVKK